MHKLAVLIVSAATLLAQDVPNPPKEFDGKSWWDHVKVLADDNRIRKVSTTGAVTTVAGNGVAGSYGDGISATAANLNSPSGVAVPCPST